MSLSPSAPATRCWAALASMHSSTASPSAQASWSRTALGWLIFLAILLHKAPEGFTMASVMLASGRSRDRGLLFRGCAGSRHAAGRAGHRAGAALDALWPARLRRRGALCRRQRPGARSQPRTRHPHGAGLFRRRGRISAAANTASGAVTNLLRTDAYRSESLRDFRAAKLPARG